MILCCGEALIDFAPIDTPAGRAFFPHAGGAVFNTARALGRLDCQAGFLATLSQDEFGEMLRTALEESGVDTSLCIPSPRPTMLAFISHEDGKPRYSFHTGGTAGRMMLAEDLPDVTPDVGFFGGISLAMEPCGTAFEVLYHRMADAGVPLVLDPNIRAGFINHERAYRNRLERMIEEAMIVKVSDEDLEWLEGPGSITQQCETLLDRGPSAIAVTEGRTGARLHTRAHEVFVAAPEVAVVDTVGAGDAFNAGLIAGLSDRDLLTPDALEAASAEALHSAMSRATAVAAASVTKAGANPPWSRDLN